MRVVLSYPCAPAARLNLAFVCLVCFVIPQVPLMYIVGEPIAVPAGLGTGEAVSEELVCQVHKQFYGALESLFYKYHKEHPMFADADFTLVWK